MKIDGGCPRAGLGRGRRTAASRIWVTLCCSSQTRPIVAARESAVAQPMRADKSRDLSRCSTSIWASRYGDADRLGCTHGESASTRERYHSRLVPRATADWSCVEVQVHDRVRSYDRAPACQAGFARRRGVAWCGGGLHNHVPIVICRTPRGESRGMPRPRATCVRPCDRALAGRAGSWNAVLEVASCASLSVSLVAHAARGSRITGQRPTRQLAGRPGLDRDLGDQGSRFDRCRSIEQLSRRDRYLRNCS